MLQNGSRAIVQSQETAAHARETSDPQKKVNQMGKHKRVPCLTAVGLVSPKPPLRVRTWECAANPPGSAPQRTPPRCGKGRNLSPLHHGPRWRRGIAVVGNGRANPLRVIKNQIQRDWRGAAALRTSRSGGTAPSEKPPYPGRFAGKGQESRSCFRLRVGKPGCRS